MRLLLTRPFEKCAATKSELEAAGHQVMVLPLIEYGPPSDGGLALRQSLRDIARYSYVVATSARAIQAMSQYISEIPDTIPLVTVGPKTAALAAELGWPVWQPPRAGGAKELIPYFKNKNLKEKKILYPQSNMGLQELPDALRRFGAEVDIIEAYQTLPTPVTTAELEAACATVDAVLFYSPSAQSAFQKLNPKIKVRQILLEQGMKL